MKKKYQITNVVVSPVIYRDKYLLNKRIKSPYKSLWAMVGGKLEVGEHPQEAIVREIEEETGLKAKFIGFKGIVNEILYKDKKPFEHFILWICETKTSNGNAQEKYEGEVKWFTKDELVKNKNKIIPSDYAMILEFFIKGKSKLNMHKSHMHYDGKTYVLEYFGK